MCIKREGVGNLCGGLFTILMLIIMFSVAHRRFRELVYICLALIAITLTVCILLAILSAVCKGEPLLQYRDSINCMTNNTNRSQIRYRHQSYSSLINLFNQQRVQVCAPPSMGGARLNIIYTIGQQNNLVGNIVTPNVRLPNESHSLAINIDDNYRYSSNIIANNSDMSSEVVGNTDIGSQCLQFSPIITFMANSSEAENNLAFNCQQYSIDSRLTLENQMNFQFNDLPPLYQPLDLISRSEPPTYAEAIGHKTTDNKS